mmetsp:Transcript_25613/g.60760  ORF Transcript_25613/g.60760 Transcript_25613/m.60760 type:complete len:497 (-) Transcript_25613:138-1628(-)
MTKASITTGGGMLPRPQRMFSPAGDDDSREEATFRRCRPYSTRSTFFWMLVGVISVLVGSATRGHALPVRVGLFEGEELPGDRNFKPLPPFNSSLSPIILIPGIGGSVMVEKKSAMRVWIRFYEATFYFQRFMWGKYNSTTNTMDPLPGQPTTVPLLSGFGLDGIRNLDPGVHWPIYDFLLEFDAIIKVLEQQGWVAGQTLFGAPYDFRQSMCWEPTISGLRDLVLKAQSSAGRKVTLVSHSMGGLVVRCLLAKYPALFTDAVEAWVSVATPHRGAGAKILMEFLQGYNLGNIVVKPSDAKSLALEAPSVYELLPFEDYAWVQAPYTALTMNGQLQVYAVGKGNVSDAYVTPLREACRTHSRFLPPDGTEDLEPFNEELYTLSQQTRRLVANVQLPASVRFYNVYGVKESTPIGVQFGTVESWADLASAKYQEHTADGDGTVPVESATGHGFTEEGSVAVAAHHLALLQQKPTIDMILRAATESNSSGSETAAANY